MANNFWIAKQWLGLSVSGLLALFALLVFMQGSANAEPPLENASTTHSPITAVQLQQLSERIQNPAVLRAEFQQAKRIAGMSRSLPSSGQLIYSRTEGLYWHTQLPFVSSLVLNDRGIVEMDEDGNRNVVSLDDKPGMALFMQVFLAIASGDLSTLQQYFTITGSITDTQWQLTLLPIDDSLSKMLSTATLQGDDLLRQVTVSETSGDSTVIEYHNVRLQPATLTAAEALLFTP